MDFTTQILLRHTPEDAIVMMVNEENGTRFPSGTFHFGMPEVVDNSRETRIRLTVRDSVHKLDEVPYDGVIDFTYHRLDMADHFDDILSGFRPELPTSSQVLLEELKRRLGQDFFLEDIVHEDITRANAAPYRLKAKAESLRWYGYIDVMLVDLTDLNALLANATPANLGPLAATPQLRDPSINYAFINGTPYTQQIRGLSPGQLVQSTASAIVPIVRNTVPTPGQPLGTTPWQVNTQPRPFNLYNARVITPAGSPNDVPGKNWGNPNLNRVLTLELDPVACQNFPGMQLHIPYMDSTFAESEFTTQPRLTQSGLVSATNGTPWNQWLNSLPVSHVITSLGSLTSPFELIPGEIWVANPTPSKTNLYNAVVQYNGQRRPQDIPPIAEGLNRVMVVTLSDRNTVFRGNMLIHYRAPIVMNPMLPPAIVGVPYNAPLQPNSGQGPYTLQILDGALAPGHYIDELDHTVKGTTEVVGSWTATIVVHGADGTQVVYRYSYASTATELRITGDAQDGVVGVPYDHPYQITGGVKPYRTTLFSGTVGGGLELTLNGHRIIGTPIPGAEGPKTYRVEVLDAMNTAAYLDDSFTIHPPAIPAGPADPYWNNVVSHLGFRRGQLVDLKEKIWTPMGDAFVDINGGLILNATDDCIFTEPHPDFNFGEGDFTFEQIITLTQGDVVLFDMFNQLTNSWQFAVNPAGVPYVSVQGAGQIVTGGLVSVLNQAALHVAWCRNNGVSRLFIGGVRRGQVTDTRNYNRAMQVATVALGAQLNLRNPRYDTVGVIHAQRITTGIGRYVANFNAPTSFETHG